MSTATPWISFVACEFLDARFQMKLVFHSAFVLLLSAAPVFAQQSAAPKNAGLPSSRGQLSAAVSEPVASVRTIGVSAEKLKIVGVPNAGKISDVLIRGAQPSLQGLTELKKLGVTTIVDLRGNRGEVNWERLNSEALGMHFVNIPILGWSSPGDVQVAQFLKLFAETNQKIFVHCRFGEDRTGVMVAA